MKIVISIFCLPYEIDELENTLSQLKKSSYHLNDEIEWVLDVTMTVSNKMVNWDDSTIPQSYFVDKFAKLNTNSDWCVNDFQTSETILGCVSQRRSSLINHKDADYFIWLDTDIVFDERTLLCFQMAIENTNETYVNSIITPELVRIWDSTWDVLVNEQFIDKPFDYNQTNDPYIDSGIKGNISVDQVSPPSQFKFAGGWFTCISGNLLRRIGIPESFGHYGLEDTFIMACSEKLMIETNFKVTQFKLKNLVVCENYIYRNNQHYLSNMTIFNRKEEFRNIAHSQWESEIIKIK